MSPGEVKIWGPERGTPNPPDWGPLLGPLLDPLLVRNSVGFGSRRVTVPVQNGPIGESNVHGWCVTHLHTNGVFMAMAHQCHIMTALHKWVTMCSKCIRVASHSRPCR